MALTHRVLLMISDSAFNVDQVGDPKFPGCVFLFVCVCVRLCDCVRVCSCKSVFVFSCLCLCLCLYL